MASHKKIKNLKEQPSLHSFNIDKIYETLRTSNDKIYLNNDQQEGILTCLQNKISVITVGRERVKQP